MQSELCDNKKRNCWEVSDLQETPSGRQFDPHIPALTLFRYFPGFIKPQLFSWYNFHDSEGLSGRERGRADLPHNQSSLSATRKFYQWRRRWFNTTVSVWQSLWLEQELLFRIQSLPRQHERCSFTSLAFQISGMLGKHPSCVNRTWDQTNGCRSRSLDVFWLQRVVKSWTLLFLFFCELLYRKKPTHTGPTL